MAKATSALKRRFADEGYKVEKKPIARGRYGLVFRAIEIETGNLVVLKVSDLNNTKSKSAFENEVNAYKWLEITELCLKLKRTFSLKFASNVPFFKKRKFGVIVLPNMQSDYVDILNEERENKIDKEIVKQKFLCICKQIQEMHKIGLVHLDVKPDNFLVNGDEIKLCDFGSVREISTTVHKRIGTESYMSPEMYQLSSSSSSSSSSIPLLPLPAMSPSSLLSSSLQGVALEKCDIWSLGVSLFTMLTGNFPFIFTDDGMLLNDEISSELDDLTRNFFSYMTALDPKDRPTIDQLIEHEWFLS